ncbi:hypothetical protein PsYK624_165700 [Phanerochaete sordida]|uniref:RanBD1 domain-containing protein n=1 Tax=Phanerochaete sordida TaxID=48140 RepID=A0A9P3LMC6_9APHY|nr:hypothetical protein PsYK624_165700 [Phanerochaete sordida]
MRQKRQLYDFNIVYCAIATVSAAVGYQYTRRRSERSRGSTRSFELRLPSYTLSKRRNSDASQALSDVSATTESDSSDDLSEDSPMPAVFEPISDVTEPGSLKRKVRDDDDVNVNTSGSPQSETALEPSPEPPRKRCRTPSKDEKAAEPATLRGQSEWQTDVISLSARAAHASEAMNSVSPAPTGAPLARARPAAMPSSFTVPACKPSDAFAAFAGTASAFAAAQAGQQPAWYRGGAGPAVAESTEDPSAPSSTAASDSMPESAVRDEVWQPNAAVALPAGSPEDDPLAASAWTKSTHVVVTGEEDEDVKVELKGAKLFVKRGSGDFTTAMIGHMKLLSHRADKSERLVFRREPVWKVSMSVGLCPAVRCSFDEDQGILRVTLKETISDIGPAADQQVVLYALKRGRVPRDEFAAFAQEVVRSSLAVTTLA